jgi:hypothetical protein
MGTRTSEETLAAWRAIIDGKKASGLSVIDYCQRIGKTVHQFRYWYRRLRNEGAMVALPQVPAEGFIELARFSSCRETEMGIDIQIGTATIALTPTTDEALFRRALSTVAAVLGGGEARR